MTAIDSIAGLAARIQRGDKLALPVDYAGVSMAVTGHLLANRPDNLHLVGVPTIGMQADILIGAGLVATVETSAVTLGEAGGAPRFNHAIKTGSIKMMDATCPAIHAGLLAAQKGVPFMPIRGIIGSDILVNRPDWKVIDNPFGDDDPILLVPALHCDVALFHAPKADREGNVWLGRRRELAAMAYAAKRTLVTVEEIVEGSLLDNEETAAGVLPSIYVEAIAEAPNGALPYGSWGQYPADGAEIAAYAAAAATQEGFEAYLAGAAWLKGDA